MSGDRARCLDAGMDDYVSKPFRPEELYQKLDQWLEHEGVKEADASLVSP